MKLDKSKPYGSVHGDSKAAFEQDGVLFDADGEALQDGDAEESAVVETPAPLKKPGK
ncbi:MAG: hypothetical protein PHT88_04755 [Candidatus Moranbacteria bacterium]|nr:hypothetical protein [Candidatus Moranbacteria bacterium]